jgi:CRISPR-associated protein Csh1
MINTLLKIGKWKAEKMNDIDRFISEPKLNTGKKDLVLNLIFDLDEKNIQIEIAKDFDKKNDPSDLLLLKVKGGNNKAIYPTAEKTKFIQIIKTFFGKIEEIDNNTNGELYYKYKELFGDDEFTIILTEIFGLKDVLKNLISEIKDGEVILNEKKLFSELKLVSNENAIIVYSSIKSILHGFNKPKAIAQTTFFKKFINKFLFETPINNSQQEQMCYASGETHADVLDFKLDTRYSLNKMFVTETQNYASNFDSKNFNKNYQVSLEKQKELDIASTYLLKNNRVKIAGLDHVLIPQFLSNTDIDFDFALDKIQTKTDFIFKYNELKKLDINIKDEIGNEIYWLNFSAIDSDGNYFKTTDLIKDISSPYFLKILKSFEKVNIQFFNYLNSEQFLNFYTIFRYIPINSKTKKNEAFALFKDVLEHHKIETEVLFKHFTKYLICQRSGQFDSLKNHRAYGNIKEATNFDYAIKNAVFNYLAFIQVLKELNLINIKDMEGDNEVLKPLEESSNDFGQRIVEFFKKMSYTENQKALFYLGRVLSQIAYAQYNKQHKNKPVLNKINYNGMEKDDIIRLRVDLAEKARQYNIVNKVEYNFSNFTNLFNANDKTQMLSPTENVFYILSGYSYGMVTDTEEIENSENSNINE